MAPSWTACLLPSRLAGTLKLLLNWQQTGSFHPWAQTQRMHRVRVNIPSSSSGPWTQQTAVKEQKHNSFVQPGMRTIPSGLRAATSGCFSDEQLSSTRICRFVLPLLLIYPYFGSNWCVVRDNNRLKNHARALPRSPALYSDPKGWGSQLCRKLCLNI